MNRIARGIVVIAACAACGCASAERAPVAEEMRSENEVARRVQTPFNLVGRIRHKRIRESSGVVASRRHPGVLWTHNDRGNAAELYAITSEGRLLARYTIQDAVNDDWEDIAIDEQGRLYVGRIGNNGAEHGGPIEVLRVSEPDPVEGGISRGKLLIECTWRLHYPDEPFDCESLFVHGDSGYLISKHLDRSRASLYCFELTGGDEQTLMRIAELPIRQPVTGATLSRDGRTLAVLTYGSLFTFELNGDISMSRIDQIEPTRTATPEGKLEGICFTSEGILVTAETREIYLLNDGPPAATASAGEAP